MQDITTELILDLNGSVLVLDIRHWFICSIEVEKNLNVYLVWYSKKFLFGKVLADYKIIF